MTTQTKSVKVSFFEFVRKTERDWMMILDFL